MKRAPSIHLNVYNIIRANGNWDNWKCEVLDQLKNPTRSQFNTIGENVLRRKY